MPQFCPKDSRCYPRDMNHSVIAYAGLRQMGCDWETICKGLHINQERGLRLIEIDRMVNTYLMLEKGVPLGVKGDLRKPIICPRCRQLLSAAPCQRCVYEGAWPSQAHDLYPDVESF